MDSSLYERLGGKEAIAAVVADFRARSVADDRIKAKYVKTDAARLEAMLVDQICEATGGPCTYTGRDISAGPDLRVAAGGDSSCPIGVDLAKQDANGDGQHVEDGETHSNR